MVAADPAITEGTAVAAAALAAAIRAALPSPLGGQLGAGVVRDRCVPLVAAGWTSEQIASAARARSWIGAGAGAVVRWVTDMASENPPVAENVDREAFSSRLSGVAAADSSTEKAATIWTSNRGPDEWLTMTTDPMLAQSAVDRLTGAAHTLIIDGPSYRQRQHTPPPG